MALPRPCRAGATGLGGAVETAAADCARGRPLRGARHARSRRRARRRGRSRSTFDDGYRDNLTDARADPARPRARCHVLPGPGRALRSDDPVVEAVGAGSRDPTLHAPREDCWYGLDGAERRRSYEAVCESLERCNEQTRRQRVRALIDELEPGVEAEVRHCSSTGTTRGRWSGVACGWALTASTTSSSPTRSPPNSCELVRVAVAARVRRLDTDVRLLAYPNGSASDFDGHTERAARAAGYQGAVTTIPGRNSGSDVAVPSPEVRGRSRSGRPGTCGRWSPIACTTYRDRAVDRSGRSRDGRYHAVAPGTTCGRRTADPMLWGSQPTQPGRSR